MITTQRLLIRWMKRTDLDALAPIHADPIAMRFMGAGGTFTRAETAKFIRRQLPENAAEKEANNLDWAVCLAADGTLIGRCGIMPVTIEGRAEIEFGYLLASDYWGQGYATETGRALVAYARDEMRLPRLIGMTHPDNLASVRVIEKCGLMFEREVALPKGRRLIFGIEFGGEAED